MDAEEDEEERLQEFMESSEPARLVEALGLVYVVVRRDVKNLVRPSISSTRCLTIDMVGLRMQTGIRSPDILRNIEKELLGPLKRRVGVWTRGALICQTSLVWCPLTDLFVTQCYLRIRTQAKMKKTGANMPTET